MMNAPKPSGDITAEAVLFSRQIATLICAGVSIVRILTILEREAPPPYAEAMSTIRMRIEEGQTLTSAIADMPELFPHFFRTMIKAGEIGGILDITLGYAADLLQEEWTLSKMVGARPFLMAGEDSSADWNLLPPPERTLRLLLFCRTWGAMLSSGVPIAQAMGVAAESLPAQQRDEVLASRDILLNKGSIQEIVAPMTFLPLSARSLFVIGSECGQLDTLLLKAAELYRHQLMYQRQAE